MKLIINENTLGTVTVFIGRSADMIDSANNPEIVKFINSSSTSPQSTKVKFYGLLKHMPVDLHTRLFDLITLPSSMTHCIVFTVECKPKEFVDEFFTAQVHTSVDVAGQLVRDHIEEGLISGRLIADYDSAKLLDADAIRKGFYEPGR